MNTLRKSRGWNQRGNALIEFALTAIMLSTSLTGVITLGWSAYLYDSLITRVTDGARYASRVDCSTGSVSDYQTAVARFVVYGNPAGGATAAVPNLTTGNVNVTLDRATTPPVVTVSIRDYSMGVAGIGVFTLTSRPSVTMPYAGFCF